MAEMILPEWYPGRDWMSWARKRVEVWGIERYWDWRDFLLKEIAWHRIRNENGEQMFQDEAAVMGYMCETKMVTGLIQFEERITRGRRVEMDRRDLMYAWNARNLAMGKVALPMG